MNTPDIRIEQLAPMCVATIRAVSATPERDAWRVLNAWAQARGLFANPAEHPVFGFNNPPPAPGCQEYGYEFWIQVKRDAVRGPCQLELKDFPGGLYAITTCRLKNDPRGSILDLWTRLWQSVQESPYRWRQTHELERPHDPHAPENAMILDLLLPVELRTEAKVSPSAPVTQNWCSLSPPVR